MDNPNALANIIINDIYDLKLPIEENPKMLKFWKEHKLLDPEREKRMNNFANKILLTPRS